MVGGVGVLLLSVVIVFVAEEGAVGFGGGGTGVCDGAEGL